jgi:hypothetical protein
MTSGKRALSRGISSCLVWQHLIIAGVSQRFVLQVYGLECPACDRRRLIFWPMNGRVVLSMVSDVLLLTPTGHATCEERFSKMSGA